VRRGKKSTMPESAKTLKGGDLGFGSILFLGKNLPSPRFKMNLFLDYSVESGKIHYSSEIRTALEKLSELLQGMTANTHIIDSELESEIDTNDLC